MLCLNLYRTTSISIRVCVCVCDSVMRYSPLWSNNQIGTWSLKYPWLAHTPQLNIHVTCIHNTIALDKNMYILYNINATYKCILYLSFNTWHNVQNAILQLGEESRLVEIVYVVWTKCWIGIWVGVPSLLHKVNMRSYVLKHTLLFFKIIDSKINTKN